MDDGHFYYEIKANSAFTQKNIQFYNTSYLLRGNLLNALYSDFSNYMVNTITVHLLNLMYFFGTVKGNKGNANKKVEYLTLRSDAHLF